MCRLERCNLEKANRSKMRRWNRLKFSSKVDAAVDLMRFKGVAEFNLPKMSPCRRYPTWERSDYVGRSVPDLHPSAWSMANGRSASGAALVIRILPLAQRRSRGPVALSKCKDMQLESQQLSRESARLLTS